MTTKQTSISPPLKSSSLNTNSNNDYINPIVEINSCNLKLKCLLDTGSQVSLIKRGIALKLHQDHKVKISPSNKTILGINGQSLDTDGILHLPINLSPTHKLYHNFIICSTSSFSGAILLGSDFFNRVNARIRYDSKELIVDKHIFPLLKNKHCSHQLSFRLSDSKDSLPSNAILTDSPIIVPKLSTNLFDINTPAYMQNNKTYLIENVLDKSYPFKLAHCFVTNDTNNKIRLSILNSSEQDITIPSKSWLGISSPVEIINHNQLITHDEVKTEIDKMRKKVTYEHLSSLEKNQLFDVLLANKDVFASKDNPIGETSDIAHIDKVTDDIVNIRQFKLPQATVTELDRQVDEMIKADIIEVSNSKYNNPVFLVTKANGTYRFVTDFRALNKCVAPISFPLPDISNLVHSIHNAKYFSVADLKSGYLNVPLAPESREYTAFSTHNNKFQFKRLPYGLRTSASIFSCILTKILQTGLNKYLLTYVDDVLIHSKTFDQHLIHLQSFFDLIRKGNVKLALSKCHFGQKRVKFLGFNLEDGSIRPSFDNIKAIIDFPTPKRQKNVRQFLATVNFYREFIPRLGELTAPLTHLLKKEVKFKWTPECDEAFKNLKNALSSDPILKMPDYDLPFELHTDGSFIAIGSALMQRHNDTLHPVAYFSRKLRPNERKWSISQIEGLAVIESIRKFNFYLFAKHFKVFTDHKSLTNIFTDGSKNNRLARWANELSTYDFDIIYKPGKDHILPDLLSRPDVLHTDAPCEINVCVVNKAFKIKDNNVNNLVDKLSLKNVRTELLNEPRWKELLMFLEDGNLPSSGKKHDSFCAENGVLYQYSIDKKKIIKRLVIPKSLVPTALSLSHDSSITSAHAGMLKTYFRSKKLFYFPNQLSLVRDHISKCDICLKKKAKPQPFHAELSQMKQAEMPLDLVEADILQMPSRSPNGNKYILLVLDNVSRYLAAFPIAQKSAAEVAKALFNYALQFGAFKEILTDKGTDFENALVKKSCEILQAKHSLSVAYRHQSNAHIERSIRTLRDYIALVSRQDQLDWESSLIYAVSAYNSSYHTGIQNTPHFLFFGRDHSWPASDALKEVGPIYNPDDVTLEMQARYNAALKLAKEATHKMHITNKAIYDKAVKPHDFKVNDIVYWKNLNKKTKQDDSYKGPYRLMSFVSKHVVKIKLLSSRKTIETHTDLLIHGQIPDSLV